MERISLAGVLAAAVASFLVGAIWYSPLLLGNLYLALRGLDPAKEAATMPIGEIVAEFGRCLVVATTYAYFVARLRIRDVGGALTLGVIVAAGFQLMGQIGGTLHEGYPPALTAIHFGDHLVKGIVAAVVVMLFQRRLPARSNEAST